MYTMPDRLGFREIRTTVCRGTRPTAKAVGLAVLVFGGLREKGARHCFHPSTMYAECISPDMRAGANQENPGRHDSIFGAETEQE